MNALERGKKLKRTKITIEKIHYSVKGNCKGSMCSGSALDVQREQ